MTEPDAPLNDWLLELVRCPVTHSRLCLAEPNLLESINQAIAAGTVKNRQNDAVPRPLDAGLVNADRSLIYPVYDGIPTLIADEAIEMASLGTGSAAGA